MCSKQHKNKYLSKVNKMSCFLNMVTSSDVIVPRREEQQQHQHHQYYNVRGEYGGAMMTTSVAPRIRVEIANGIRKGEKFITELSGCERVRDFVSMKLCKNEYLRGKEVKVYLDEYELLGDTSVDVLGHEDKIFVVDCEGWNDVDIHYYRNGGSENFFISPEGKKYKGPRAVAKALNLL